MSTFTLQDLTKQQNKHKVRFNELNAYSDTTLRDYQIHNKLRIYNEWRTNRSVMLQMPTGTGKTRLFVSIVKDLHNWGAKNKIAVKVLILAHRKELIEQIDYNVGIKYGLAHGLILSNSVEQKLYPVQIGMVPTMHRRLDRWGAKDFDVIIIDEAHHVKARTYKKILAEYPNARILGVTATPYRLSGVGFRPEFDTLVMSDPVFEFIKRGYLSDYEYYSIKMQSRLQERINNMRVDTDGDYIESAMVDVMDNEEIRANIVNTYLQYANGKKGIVYTINKTHNENIKKRFENEGIIAAAIDSDTPKEVREELVNKFRKGEITILCNVNIFSEGFDCPDIEFVQLARPTCSLAMYLQQVGRGLRPAENKEKVVILDNVGLYNKFGFPSARRNWKRYFEGIGEKEPPRPIEVQDELGHSVIAIEEGDEAVALLFDSKTDEAGEAPHIAGVLPSAIASSLALQGEEWYEEKFYDWMLRVDNMSSSRADAYRLIIWKYIDDFIRRFVDSSHTNIYKTIDCELLEVFYNDLLANEEFVELNDSKHRRYSQAFLKYISFARFYVDFVINDNVKEPDSESMTELDVVKQEIAELERAIFAYQHLGEEVPSDIMTLLEGKRRLLNPEIQIKEQITNLLQKYNIENDLEFHFRSVDKASLQAEIQKYSRESLDAEKNNKMVEDIIKTNQKFGISKDKNIELQKRLETNNAIIEQTGIVTDCLKELESLLLEANSHYEIRVTYSKENFIVKCKRSEPKTIMRRKSDVGSERHRAPLFKFSLVNIKVGEELVFVPTGVKVKVANDRQIEYQGKLYNLSSFVVEFMPDNMKYSSGAYQGSRFFTYKGELLRDLRERLGV